LVACLLHYWIGSINQPHLYYKNYYDKFNLLTDNLKILQEYKNNIPDKSWMLYLLEIFNPQQIAVELNLICQFDNQNYFEAIFNGINRYRFAKVLPEPGYIYLRQIRFNEPKSSIEYFLKNIDTDIEESYTLHLNSDSAFLFRFYTCFTGLEWWNKIESKPYPIKYKIEISNLMYGLNDNPDDSNSIIFFPVDSFSSNKDSGHWSSYPIDFNYNGIKNGCLCYDVGSGSCVKGLDKLSI
jgi:hypothetical protein